MNSFPFVFHHKLCKDVLRANGIVLNNSGKKRPATEDLETADVKEDVVLDGSGDSNKINALEVSELSCCNDKVACYVFRNGSQAQLQRFQDQIQALQTTIEDLRGTGSSSQNSQRKRVKMEPQSRASFVDREVIDLT